MPSAVSEEEEEEEEEEDAEKAKDEGGPRSQKTKQVD